MAVAETDAPAAGREPRDPARTGRVVSGTVHGLIVLWAVLGGTLFREPPPAPSRTTAVATITEAEFDALAAAARGAGPVAPGGDAAPGALATPQTAAGAAEAEPGPEPADPAPQRDEPAEQPAQPDAAGAATPPDLSDLSQPQQPVGVTTVAPEALDPGQPATTGAPAGPTAEAPPPAGVPQAATRPGAPTALDAPPVANVTPPQSPLGLDQSQRPRSADALRAALADAEAEAIAAAQAEATAEAARQLAAAQAAEQAEVERAARQAAAAEQAEAEAAAERQAEADAAAAAERDRQAAAEEAERQAAEAEAARLEVAREQAARQQAERQAAAEAEAQRQAEAEAQAAEAARLQAEADAEAARIQAEADAAEAARLQAEVDALAAADALAATPQPDTEAEALARALAEQGETFPSTIEPNPTETFPPEAVPGEADALTSALADAMAGEADDSDPVAADQPAFDDATVAAPGDDPLANALARALISVQDGEGGGLVDGNPEGGGLSDGEKAAFRNQIQSCADRLYTGLSPSARTMTVTINFDMTPEALPVAGSIRLLGSAGGSAADAQAAFVAAQQALIECTGAGYPLPLDRYGDWQNMTVNVRGAR